MKVAALGHIDFQIQEVEEPDCQDHHRVGPHCDEGVLFAVLNNGVFSVPRG